MVPLLPYLMISLVFLSNLKLTAEPQQTIRYVFLSLSVRTQFYSTLLLYVLCTEINSSSSLPKPKLLQRKGRGQTSLLLEFYMSLYCMSFHHFWCMSVCTQLYTGRSYPCWRKVVYKATIRTENTLLWIEAEE